MGGSVWASPAAGAELCQYDPKVLSPGLHRVGCHWDAQRKGCSAHGILNTKDAPHARCSTLPQSFSPQRQELFYWGL